MADIDLIPQAWRRASRLRQRARRAGACALAVVLGVAAGKGALAWSIGSMRPEVQALQMSETRASAERAAMDTLRAERTSLDERLRALSALRVGGSVGVIGAALDQALSDAVWLRAVTFRRDTETAAPAPEARQAGYFVVVPNGLPKADGSADTTTFTRQRLDLKGQALSHVALAEFIDALARQRGVRDVRVVSTASAEFAARKVVDFEMAAWIDPIAGQKP